MTPELKQKIRITQRKRHKRTFYELAGNPMTYVAIAAAYAAFKLTEVFL